MLGQKYRTYKRMPVKVRGHQRYDPRAKRMVQVNSYMRNQKVRDYSYFNQVMQIQEKEEDWSHRSINYPNIIGLTDEEIEKFIKENEVINKNIREYVKHIKCYNQEDIKEISRKTYKKFITIMIDKDKKGELSPKNPYLSTRTIFITSPRGGFEILSDFGYANKLEKDSFPYDLEKGTFYSESTLESDSLPYGTSIKDVNDLVFIDDIYMSGDQAERGLNTLNEKLKKLNIHESQRPRLHYIALVGNKNITRGRKGWDTFIIGEEHSFETKKNDKTFEDISAVVFPFSIPDGSRHLIARKLYRDKKRFSHRGLY